MQGINSFKQDGPHIDIIPILQLFGTKAQIFQFVDKTANYFFMITSCSYHRDCLGGLLQQSSHLSVCKLLLKKK